MSHRGHVEFGGRQMHENVSQENRVVESAGTRYFQLDESMLRLRQPARHVSAPPTSHGFEQFAAGSPMPALPRREAVSERPARLAEYEPNLAPGVQGDPSQATMNVMAELLTVFDLSLSEYDHIEWLVQTGLVAGLHGAIQAAETVGSARKPQKDSPVILQETTNTVASVSLQASAPPPSWLVAAPAHDANAPGPPGPQALQSPIPSRQFYSPAQVSPHERVSV